MTHPRLLRRGDRPRSTAITLALVATLVTAFACASAGATNVTAGAQTRPAQVQPGTLRMELIDEKFGFGPDESLHLVYRLTGDLDGFGLTPPPETTLPATTIPATTIPPDTAPTSVSDPPPIDPTTGVPPAPETTSTITTTTIAPIPVIPLAVEVTNYPPLTAASDIGDLVGGDVDRNAFRTELGDAVDGVQLADARSSIVVADDGTVTLTVDVPTDVANSVEERLKFERPGLYPIRTELVAGEEGADTVLATHGTIVQRLPGPADPLDVAPPISLTVMTAIAAAGSETTPSEEQAAIAAFDAAVDMASTLTSPVTLMVPPPIVSAAADGPENSTRLASALDGDSFVAMPAVPLDVSSAVAAGKQEDFASDLGAGEDMLASAVPTTPTRRNVWIATDALSAAGARELRDLGFRYLVMSDELYRTSVDDDVPATDLFVEVVLPDGGTLPLIVVDPLSQDLTTDATDDILESSTAIEWAVTNAAVMLIAQADDQPRLERSRVLSTPDLGPADPRLLVGLETLLRTTPSIEFTDASLTARTDVQTLAGQPVQIELPLEAGPSLTARVELLDSTALSAASAGSMLPPDDPRPTTWATALEAMISTAVSDTEAAAVTSGIQSEADAIRGSVVPPAPFSFTLTGRSGVIELQVTNTSDDPLTVILRSSSPKVSFPDSTEPTVGPASSDAGDHIVTLRPNDETAVVIPVRAKSNGTSPITVQMLTPAGEEIGQPVTLTATVTAFTGLGQVLTAGLVLVLLTWWATHWRSRRRAALLEVRERHPSGSQ